MKFEVTATWDRPEKKEHNELRAVNETPTSALSGQAEYCDNLCQKQLNNLEIEEQQNDHHRANLNIIWPHRRAVHKNEIYDMQTEKLTSDYTTKNALKDD